MAPITVIWCRACAVGFALPKPYPPICPNDACRKPADWAQESPTPVPRYNLTDKDMRLLRGLRIAP